MKYNIKHYPFDKKYISDGIGNSYKSWKMIEKMNSSTKVFIESPTGTGKTTFIIEKLLPYAIKMNRSIVYICNRDILKHQIANSIKEHSRGLTFIDIPNSKMVIFEYQHSYGRFLIVNYQFAQHIDDILIDPYYVIYDEVHFFAEDALFNVETSRIFNKLFYKYIRQVHIYMSATMVEFFPLYYDMLNYLMPAFYKKNHVQPEIFAALYKINIVHYYNSYVQRNYNIILYKNEDYLLEQIQKSDNEKWLIFISSKNEGIELKKYINKITCKKCRVLTAQNKNIVTWKKLVEKNMFDEDVLISTKVIDSGVSIIDETVSNIVVPFVSQTELVQMIGRRRISEKESKLINIYVRQPSIQEITLRLRMYKRKLKFIDTVVSAKSNRAQYTIVKEYWKKPEYNNLFTIRFKEGHVYFNTNILAVYKLVNLISFYEYLNESHANPQVYIDCLRAWLGDNIDTISCEEMPRDIDNLIDFLNDNIDIPILDTDTFYTNFLELYKIYCYNQFMKCETKEQEKFKKALSIRKGNTQRKATINRSLAFLDLPYFMRKKNNAWVLERIPNQKEIKQ